MSRIRTRSFAAFAALSTALLVLALAGVTDAKPPRRGGRPNQQQNPPQQQPGGEQPSPGASETPAPPPAVGEVDRLLAEYKTGEARSAIAPLSGQADSNPYVSMALGRVLDQEKKYSEATTRLRKAAELAPADPAPQVYLGEALLRARKNGEADAAFRKAAEIAQGKGGDGLYYLGVAQQRLRQFDQAVETLERARGQAPSNSMIPFQIGVTRAFQEQWTPAVEQLSRAIDMNSGLAYAYYYRGLAYDKLNRKDQLVKDMERFLALAPDAPEADRARAVLQAARR
jgi:tetratricopeptide (TPR) repeat protein